MLLIFMFVKGQENKIKNHVMQTDALPSRMQSAGP